MNVFEFMSNSPVLSFLIAMAIAYTIVRVVQLGCRSMNIRKHGWPPAHVDADGTFKVAVEDDYY